MESPTGSEDGNEDLLIESRRKNEKNHNSGLSQRIDQLRSFSSGGEAESDTQEQIRLMESPDLDPKINSYPPLDDGDSVPHIRIDRPVLNQMVLFPRYDPHKGFNRAENLQDSSCCKSCLAKFKFSPLRLLLRLVPILDWLPKYKWKNDLSYDLVAGFTIAIMHIPQGMAYALLGNLPPIVGIYMAFFPVIVYSFLGTSRQVSMGTFAVVCLMTGKVALDRLSYEIQGNATSILSPADLTIQIDAALEDDATKTRMVEIATAISLAVGLWQLVMGIFKLGSLSLLLSPELVSGFTTGAAVHVFTSQIKNLLGVSLTRRSGIFKIILTYLDMGKNLWKTNLTALFLSTITLFTLVFYNEIIKPHISKKIPFPVPLELLTIIAGTLVSFYFELEGQYNISVVSTIPTGFPTPALAPLDIFSSMIVDGLIIAVVAYAISISMCKIFAEKHNYSIDPNQELIAQGTSNFVGSFFSCAPVAASLSRSVIQDTLGGKTQLVGLFSSSLLIFVLLWIGPFFETLPNCVLSGIIVVALKGMFLQFSDLPKAWKISKVNACVWLLTFLGTVMLDIEYGLGIGVFLSVSILVWTSTHGSLSVLGALRDYDIYVDLKTNQEAKEIPGIRIFKYTGCLNFVNGEKFVRNVEKSAPLIDEVVLNEKPLTNLFAQEKGEHGNTEFRRAFENGANKNDSIGWIILDFSSLSSVDSAGLTSLLGLHTRFLKDEIQVLYAGSPPSVLHVMESASFLKEIGISRLFPSVHDAVSHVLHQDPYSRPSTSAIDIPIV